MQNQIVEKDIVDEAAVKDSDFFINGKPFDAVAWINNNLAPSATSADVDELIIKLNTQGTDFVEILQQSSQQLFHMLPQVTKEAEFIHQVELGHHTT